MSNFIRKSRYVILKPQSRKKLAKAAKETVKRANPLQTRNIPFHQIHPNPGVKYGLSKLLNDFLSKDPHM